MSDKEPETAEPAVEHIELDEVQLDAAVGGVSTSYIPCIKSVPCIKVGFIPCVKTPRPPQP